jgi:hypothetical protein
MPAFGHAQVVAEEDGLGAQLLLGLLEQSDHYPHTVQQQTTEL